MPDSEKFVIPTKNVSDIVLEFSPWIERRKDKMVETFVEPDDSSFNGCKHYAELDPVQHRYEAGIMLIFVYKRNYEYPDAIENSWLDEQKKKYDNNCRGEDEEEEDGNDCREKDEEDGSLTRAVEPSFQEIRNKARYPVSRVVLRTIMDKHTGSKRLTIISVEDATPSYQQLSSIRTCNPSVSEADLNSVPQIPMKDLEHIRPIAIEVDIVRWRQSYYTLKRAENDRASPYEIAILLLHKNSPCIIDIAAITVDNIDCKSIRGFLTPFMEGGDLEELLRINRILRDLPADTDIQIIDDSLKMHWAEQITNGVASLHSKSTFSGDLKPGNVLIDRAGNAFVIDFQPVGTTDAFAPPEMLKQIEGGDDSMRSASADMYSLGVLLWCVMEEKTLVPERDGDHNIANGLPWRTNVPKWYPEIVEMCLNPDPKARPEAKTVVKMLMSGSQPQSIGSIATVDTAVVLVRAP